MKKRKARTYWLTNEENEITAWETEEKMYFYINTLCPKCNPVEIIVVKEVLPKKKKQ